MKIEAAHQKQRLSEPIAIIAHQLKNPIAVFKSYLEVLRSRSLGPLTSQQEDYLADMEENVLRMRALVGKLIDVSRIEEKRFELSEQKFDIYPVAEDVVKDLSMWAKTRGSVLHIIPADGEYLVTSDLFKIRDVIENFVSNAIKYNPSGKGNIEVSLSKTDDRVIFSCKDNGIGIDEESRKKLFTKFYRSHQATQLDARGTGLGLYLSKAIIEQSGGTIGYRANDKGTGTIFYFELPRAT